MAIIAIHKMKKIITAQYNPIERKIVYTRYSRFKTVLYLVKQLFSFR